jgi:transcription initiation factor TFIIIB Brf1 subunit/transcription initiation factor TFIIB
MCDGIVVFPQGSEGEKICSQCGLVIDETPNFKSFAHWTPEWYSNWDEEDSETLKEWLTVLRAVSCQLDIPNYPFREEAARTIRTKNGLLAKSQKLSKNKRATVAALMHLILKEYNKTRSLKEISKQLSLDGRTVMKHTWLLSKTLDGEKQPLRIKRKTSLDYLRENAGKLTDNKKLMSDAENVLLLVKKTGGNPMGLAAGAFYNSCKNNKTKFSKEEIGQSFQISPRTVYTNEARIRKLIAKMKTNRI